MSSVRVIVWALIAVLCVAAVANGCCAKSLHLFWSLSGMGRQACVPLVTAVFWHGTIYLKKFSSLESGQLVSR